MDNIKDKEKFIGESKLLGTPETKFTFKLKKGSVTEDKLAPNAVDWDKLSQRLRDLLVAIQAAIGEVVDPDTIKEMIRNVIREMIDSGDEIIDEDALADRITQAVLNSLGEKYPPFKLDDSEISNPDLIDQIAPSETVGEVVFSTTLHTFLFKVTDKSDPNYGNYYKAWEGSDDYLTNNNADPKKGVIFMVEDGSDYYYWDGHNLVPLGSKDDGGEEVEVKVDELGITLNNDSEIALKNIPHVLGNKMGTTYIWGNKIPIELNTTNTRYLTAADLSLPISGISLLNGSKLVPNGGIPIVPVTGGEMSWVHSSDIGMIQDDGSHNPTFGDTNFDIFKKIVNSRFNLILDGDYYIRNTETSIGNEAVLNRSFCIKGGTIFLHQGILIVTEGGYLNAENVTFSKIPETNKSGKVTGSVYPNIYLRPDGGMIEGVEFINCTFTSDWRYSVPFMRTIAPDMCPMGKIPYKRWSEGLLQEISYTKSITDTYDINIYAFPNDYTIIKEEQKLNPDTDKPEYDEDGEPVMIKVKKVYKADGTFIEQEDWKSYAKEIHPLFTDAPLEDADGNILFIIDSANYTDKTVGSDGVASFGYYINEQEARSDLTTNGKKYSIQVNPNIPIATKEVGIKRIRMIDCNADNTSFSFGDITCRDLFEVINCNFTKITNKAISIGSDNNKQFAGEWLQKSCCSVFENCSFSGPGGVIRGITGGSYTCGILAEGNAVHIRNCRFVDLISNYYATYECYLSVGEIIFENNYVFNVFSVPQYLVGNEDVPSYNRKEYYMPLFEWMKSKGAPKVGDREPTRIFRNNWYEIDYGVAWNACKSYMESKEQYGRTGYDPQEVFNTYAMKQTMLNFISKAVFRDVVIEGNAFIFKEGTLVSPTITGKTNYIRNLTLRNNIFNFKSYPTEYDRPLIAMRYIEDVGTKNIEITGNKFVSGTSQTIQLLGTAGTSYKDIVVQNNTFENCNYRITSGMAIIEADTVCISNNTYDCPVGIPSVISHQRVAGDDSGKLTYIHDFTNKNKPCNIKYRGDLFRLRGRNYSYVEVYDKQNYYEGAEASKILAVPTDGAVTIRTPYMNRSLAIGDDNYPVYDNTTSLIFTYIRRGVEKVKSSWIVEISYTINGKRIQRHMEILCHSKNSYSSTVVRDVNGYISGDYADKDVLFSSLSSLEDVGLRFFLENRGLHDLSAGIFALHVFTGEEGTKNDRNTDIVITVRSSTEKGKFTAGSLPDYTNLNPIKEFVPSGSEVTQQWLNTVAGNFSWMGSANPRTGPYMRPTDVGLRVHVGPDWYTWKGTWNSTNNSWKEGAGWEVDKRIVVLTQAEYEALTAKDPNTLYVIQDPQS